LKNYHTSLSAKILSVVQANGDTSLLRRQLYFTRADKLEKSLNTDDLKKTFWINIYYAYFLIMKKENIALNSRYNLKRIRIARTEISLNDIEFGILKKSTMRLGLSYFVNPFHSKFVKTMSIQEMDYRIHFAIQSITLKKTILNYYDSELLNEQLEETMKLFISQKMQQTSSFQ
jgi:hypothetical protein